MAAAALAAPSLVRRNATPSQCRSLAAPSLVRRNATSSQCRSLAAPYARTSQVRATRLLNKEILGQRRAIPRGSPPLLWSIRRRATLVPRALKGGDEVLDSDYKRWDALSGRLAEAATVAFLLLQLPQIILNTQNLMAGNNVALTAIPWMGQLTGLLGNLSLLSYFAGKRERGATVVQAVGVLSTGVVISQLALGGAMPYPIYLGTAVVVVSGLLFNWLSYFNKLSPTLWQLWLDSVTVGGLTVLPQVMWSTFVPYVPPSVLPGSIFGSIALLLVVLNRLNKLPPAALKFYTGLSAWTATLLFMWGPVAQAWSNYLNPSNIKGLSVLTILLAMAGNGLLLPRALFTRDLMWFTGSSWGTLLQGWGILVTMFIFQVINEVSFYGVSVLLALWLGWMFVNDAKAYSLKSPVAPLIELVTGSRST